MKRCLFLSFFRSTLLCCILASAAAVFSGCATPALTAARTAYYAGRFEDAATTMPEKTGTDNRVLLLMENGMLEQSRGNYADSARMWIAATALARELDYMSLSRSSSSLLINDTTLAFRGMPYERTFCHAFAALSFILLNDFESAAVEARNIIKRLENRDRFPDCAFSRYLAGFCLEAMHDNDAAAVQYRHVAELAPAITLNPSTGRFTMQEQKYTNTHEMICFIGLGRSGTSVSAPARVTVNVNGQILGQAHLLSDRQNLQFATDAVLATLKTTKATARIALKESIAYAVETKNEALGELLRLILYSLEKPDTRHWDTLPRWFYVARLPAPAIIKDWRIDVSGGIRAGIVINHPVISSGTFHVAVCRAY